MRRGRYVPEAAPVLEWSLWPNEKTAAQPPADRIAMAHWRAAASALAGQSVHRFLAPWLLAPATAYWWGQPAAAGSSHESLPGIIERDLLFLSTSRGEASEILPRHGGEMGPRR